MKSKLFNWIFLFVQITLAIYFVAGQCNRITYSTQGLSLVMFSGFFISMFINLILAFKPQDEAKKDKEGNIIKTKTRNYFIILVYLTWTIVVSVLIAYMLIYGVLNTLDYSLEKLMLYGIVSGAAILTTTAKLKKWKITDAYVKGGISAIFKSFPQLMLIPIAINNGVTGWDPGTIWVGHVTILIRIILLIVSIKKDGKTRENIAILFSEIFNSLSWMAFTAVYYYLV